MSSSSRPVLAAALVLAVAQSTSAQQAMSAQQTAPMRRTAPLRDGGTFHLDTGTWTRKSASHAALGPDVLYNNTCSTGYFAPLSQATFVDEGRLPSPTAPTPTGCAANYRVDGFTFSYCTDQVAGALTTYTHAFYQSYSACGPIVGTAPTAMVTLTGLPASPITGNVACWSVTIDLGVTGSFVLAADGDGDFDGGPTADRFGWAMRTSAPGTQTGPAISGAPTQCPPGSGTVFSPPPGVGTGLGNNDSFRITEVPPGSPLYLEGCHFFGGNPFAGFALALYGTACPTTTTGEVLYCFGDGAGTPCPCANHAAPAAQSGCLNSLATGATLRALGTASLANDSLSLLGANMTNAPCLYFQGTTRQNGGFGDAFGDGLRCAGGAAVRLGAYSNGNGSSQIPAPNEARISVRGGVASPGTRTYQVWYRNVAAFCTPAGFNLSNGLEITWAP